MRTSSSTHFVSRGSSAVLSQGSSSSLQPLGMPLYPMPTIFFSSFTMQAPTVWENLRAKSGEI